MAMQSYGPRTYNQVHVPRKHTPGKRRMSAYVAWSYPAEAQRDATALDNRFSTMTEVRRVVWPNYENDEYGSSNFFLQGIAGTLELFFQAWTLFQHTVGEITGHPVAMYQRVDQAGYRQLLDDRVLADTDTLLVFGLDHNVTEQKILPEEIEAVRNFLSREGTCLIMGPHHDVGVSDDLDERQMEYRHHGDALVPRQQRFGLYTRGLMEGLGIPVEARYGLRPVTLAPNRIGPLTINRDLDSKGWLKDVTGFNFHMHLPHYAILPGGEGRVRLLGSQPIDMKRPHPFTNAGNREFNAFLWMPPEGKRAGDILFTDSTVFSTLFGADESLVNFWRNLATL